MALISKWGPMYGRKPVCYHLGGSFTPTYLQEIPRWFSWRQFIMLSWAHSFIYASSLKVLGNIGIIFSGLSCLHLKETCFNDKYSPPHQATRVHFGVGSAHQRPSVQWPGSYCFYHETLPEGLWSLLSPQPARSKPSSSSSSSSSSFPLSMQ